MSYNLTQGAIKRIMNGEELHQPVLQILGIKKLAGSQSSGLDRYRLLLSDGQHSIASAMLATQLNGLVESGQLEANTVIQLEKYLCNKVQPDRKVVIMLQVSVVAPGAEVGGMIGSPVTYQSAAGDTQANSNAPAASATKPNVSAPPAKKPSFYSNKAPAMPVGGNQERTPGSTQAASIPKMSFNFVPISELAKVQKGAMIVARHGNAPTGMDPAHRKILTKNLVAFCNDLQVELVMVELEASGMFLQYHVDIIQAEKVEFNKRRKVVQLVQQSGPKAFDLFHRALQNTCQTHLANLLKPDVTVPFLRSRPPAAKRAAPSSTAKYLPSDTPANLIDIDVRPGRPAPYDPLDAYRMESSPSGLCLIVNNRAFERLRERRGTDIDSRNARLLFEGLGFEVLPEKKDLTVAQMREELEFFAARHDHRDCAVIVVLSHGTWRNGDEIHGVDGRPAGGPTLNFNKLLRMFGREQAPALKDKPKLFIIQACRGEDIDFGSPQTKSDVSDGYSPPWEKQMSEMEPRDPNMGDHIVFRSTMPGFLSWRNPERGSWFIQSLVQVFMKNACTDNINDLMTKVNQEVARIHQTRYGAKQMTMFESTLRKPFYFNPTGTVKQMTTHRNTA
ncbi:PREDICTED: cell death protein 3-like isoform X3 [Priapulus caudatus]|uniref:Cell death protein 3-like isoform X3 n=1 Tax=Priapulus caudatus TaxID=37621 RepID=A0ABM1DX02_PRICU|nr:PREDICTED: cell death protein 3-like isoform X3 [Priapulus caudatus]